MAVGGAQFRLEIVAGPHTGDELPLAEGDIVIGRGAQCGITLPHADVAPTHCGLRVRSEQVIVAPGGTVARLTVNDEPVTRALLLRVGDTLGIGPYRLVLRVRVEDTEVRFYPGDRVGPYRLVSELGSGAVGRVFEGVDGEHHRVAVKTLRLRRDWAPADEAHRRELFEREGQALRAVSHPNVLTCLGSGEERGVPWLALELIEGSTLREYLVGGRPAVADIERIMFQLCSAVAAVHDAGVVHRDLKPANVMLVGRELRVCLADFGLAQRLGAPRLQELDPPAFSTAVRVGQQVGTPAYMPPEQSQGQEADLRSDVWSLGAMLYELISGARPFPGSDIRTVLTRVCRACPEPLPNDVAPHLRGVVYKCLQKRSDWRFANAKEMVEALHDRRLVQLVPTGIEGPNPLPLTGCPYCGAPLEHPLTCAQCYKPVFRYTDGQVMAAEVDGQVVLGCGTCAATVGFETDQCPTCHMVYTDVPPLGHTRSARSLETGPAVVIDIFDRAIQLLDKCPFCSAPRGSHDLRCPECRFGYRRYVTGRVRLELDFGGWSIWCCHCGARVEAPDEPNCPDCGLNLNNGLFPDGTHYNDELPTNLLKLLEQRDPPPR